MTDLVLAIAHHVLAFGLVSMLAAQMMLVRPGMTSADAGRVARLDAGYGGTAGLLLVIGLLRVFFGAKGHLYYETNHWFWAKFASFLLVALLSLIPTLRYLRWRKTMKTNALFVPPAEEIARLRLFLRLQLLVVIAILVFAATMARFTTA
jgi:putative membrane protein